MRVCIVLWLLAISLSPAGLAQEGRSRPHEVRVQTDRGSRTGSHSQEPRERKKQADPKRVPSSQRNARPDPSRDSSSDEQDSSPAAQAPRKRADQPARTEHKKVFDTVRSGLVSGQISSFSEHMGAQVYVNLRGGESGYFSANQAYYLLENYLKTRKFSDFEFNTTGEDESTPYATGTAGFDHKGSQENAQVYVSLSEVGDRWVISQIKIY